MPINDPLGDLLTRIRNGQQRHRATVTSPASKMRERVLEVLKREGYIRAHGRRKGVDGRDEIVVELKYHEGQPVIRKVARVSTPGRRVYSGSDAIPRIFDGLGIAILSTPKGVISDQEARRMNVGGEILCSVF
ncbi:MAG: 30S ribosomal protein S8 [Alphaproteobacteria bacterium]|nr:30S ribosomal protein S8 [Alphaproteobacteria bacterium]